MCFVWAENLRLFYFSSTAIFDHTFASKQMLMQQNLGTHRCNFFTMHRPGVNNQSIIDQYCIHLHRENVLRPVCNNKIAGYKQTKIESYCKVLRERQNVLRPKKTSVIKPRRQLRLKTVTIKKKWLDQISHLPLLVLGFRVLLSPNELAKCRTVIPLWLTSYILSCLPFREKLS